jgi:hypothetical protein
LIAVRMKTWSSQTIGLATPFPSIATFQRMFWSSLHWRGGEAVEKRADLVLLGKAVRENWQIDDACRISIVRQLGEILESDRNHRWTFRAVKLLLLMEQQNWAVPITALPPSLTTGSVNAWTWPHSTSAQAILGRLTGLIEQNGSHHWAVGLTFLSASQATFPAASTALKRWPQFLRTSGAMRKRWEETRVLPGAPPPFAGYHRLTLLVRKKK